MLFWFIAIAVTTIACAALYFAAAGRRVNAARPETGDTHSHFRLVLAGIEADVAQGRLGESEAEAARAELAREIIRQKADDGTAAIGRNLGQVPLLAAIGAVAVVSLGIYAMLGSPDLPSAPLAGRADVATARAAADIDIEDAVARIEAQLVSTPDDIRGWTVIAPVYLQSGRYADAERAYRRIIDLGGSTPDVQTSLAEALLLQANGPGSDEAMQLLHAAADADPAHVLSRLYIAAELTRTEQWDEAKLAWQQLLVMADGTEPWLPAAQEGLLVAENKGIPTGGEAAGAPEAAMIAQMVEGLATRLDANGGTVVEWTQLVRAYLVMGDSNLAQAAFDKAVTAYPMAVDRSELDNLALSGGLNLKGANP